MGCEYARRLLLFTATITIYYYCSAQKIVVFILPSYDGGRPSRPRHCSTDLQPMPKTVYHSDNGVELLLNLTIDDSQMTLSTDFIQCIPQHLILDISELDSRKHVLQQSIKPFWVWVRQLWQSIDPQCLHNKLRFKTCINFPWHRKYDVLNKSHLVVNYDSIYWHIINWRTNNKQLYTHFCHKCHLFNESQLSSAFGTDTRLNWTPFVSCYIIWIKHWLAITKIQ